MKNPPSNVFCQKSLSARTTLSYDRTVVVSDLTISLGKMSSIMNLPELQVEMGSST